jgi:chromosome partitioning protein
VDNAVASSEHAAIHSPVDPASTQGTTAAPIAGTADTTADVNAPADADATAKTDTAGDVNATVNTDTAGDVNATAEAGAADDANAADDVSAAVDVKGSVAAGSPAVHTAAAHGAPASLSPPLTATAVAQGQSAAASTDGPSIEEPVAEDDRVVLAAASGEPADSQGTPASLTSGSLEAAIAPSDSATPTAPVAGVQGSPVVDSDGTSTAPAPVTNALPATNAAPTSAPPATNAAPTDTAPAHGLPAAPVFTPPARPESSIDSSDRVELDGLGERDFDGTLEGQSALQAAASIGLGDEPEAMLSEAVSRETPEAVSPEATAAEGADEEFPESPRPVDDYPLETPTYAGTHPQRAVDKPGGKAAPTPTDILFGPSTAPIGMGAMTAAQIAARATSDELQRRLLETPIAAATERTLLVNEGRTMGREFPLPAETRVFVVANQKGGVGKTTTTVNVAAGLALYGARILVIDLDPQGNASTALGIEHSEGTPGVYEAVIEGEPLSKLLAPCVEHPGIVVVPATIDLAGAEIELVSIVARESRLKKALDAHLAETEAAGERYDYVFIDCPPSLGLLTVNALTAAREVLVPIQSEYYALEGLSQLLRHIDMVKSHLNPTLDVSTILLTMYDARTKLAGEVATEVRNHFQDSVLRTAVPRSVRISEAPSHGQTVLAYDPASAGALSYLEASREIAMRNNPS